MASLIATPATQSLGLPLTRGAATLSAVEPGPVTSIAPFRGGREGTEALVGPLPAPGALALWGGGRVIWAGEGRWLLIGVAAPEGLDAHAAVTEQGDGLAAVLLEGPSARDVLARLVPLDLRDQSFAVGASARTLLNHMTVTLTRPGEAAWEVMGMRSMAGTLVHEIEAAMRAVAARTQSVF